MSRRGVLSSVITIVTWPASRFAALRRTYDVALPAPHVCAVIRGGIAVDPMFRPIDKELLHSIGSGIVGRVVGQRFEIYVGGRLASGIGLVGTVEETPAGSRVIANVGWAGPARWIAPALTALVLLGVVVLASGLPAEIAESGSGAWTTIALLILIGGGYMGNLISRARRARSDELPKLLERLDALLAGHVR